VVHLSYLLNASSLQVAAAVAGEMMVTAVAAALVVCFMEHQLIFLWVLLIR
jgi:hypothetical protein